MILAGTFNEQILGQMNALFKPIGKDWTVCQLAHMDIFQFKGRTGVQGAEGMFCVKLHECGAKGIIVRIFQIDLIVHLVPLEPRES